MKQSFTPVRIGRYTLPNRLVMAPMTRSRAKFDGLQIDSIIADSLVFGRAGDGSWLCSAGAG